MATRWKAGHWKAGFLGTIGFGLALLIEAPAVAAGSQTDPREAAAIAALKSLSPQHGTVTLPEAHAGLDLGKNYDFYNAADARKIIVDIWGNPAGAADGVLGVVMPAGKSPGSDSWGAVITYDPSGYVADNDAKSADFNQILTDLKKNTEEANAERTKEGYPAMHIAGWAEQPNYDPATHSVVWARDLAVDGHSAHSLNYDLRTLGRSGVLSVNFVSGMGQLPEIRQAAADFSRHATFTSGWRYADFNPASDKKADYGIAGLVAAGVGVAAAKKLGVLALLAKFIKPIAVAVVAAFAALRKRISALFGRGGEI